MQELDTYRMNVQKETVEKAVKRATKQTAAELRSHITGRRYG